MPALYQFKDYLEERASEEIPSLFLNYLEAFFSSYQYKFTAQTVESFYLWLLHSTHYRLFSTPFSNNLIEACQPFFKKYHLDIEFEEMRSFLSEVQLIPLEKEQDILGALEAYYQKSQHSAIRTLLFKNRQALVLKLKTDGRLGVYHHCDLFTLRTGRLEPLPPLSALHYTSEFELETSKIQRVFDPSGLIFHFQSMDLSSFEISSFTLKKFSKIKKLYSNHLQEESSLFMQLKKIESYYIKAQTDPYYRNLIASLQQSYQMLISGDPKGWIHAQKNLLKAQNSLRNIYLKDRLLLLLTANIEYRLNVHKSHHP